MCKEEGGQYRTAHSEGGTSCLSGLGFPGKKNSVCWSQLQGSFGGEGYLGSRWPRWGRGDHEQPGYKDLGFKIHQIEKICHPC